MDRKDGGGFFAVDRLFMEKALGLGLNTAVVFLVLARGTGRNNRDTSWSVNAVENYTGIGRSRAGEALNQLKTAGCLENTKAGTRPRYSLGMAEDPSLIWLPNELVTGAASETPPLELLRQTQSVDSLRLFVRCYAVNNMPDDGGLPRSVIFGKHDVKTVLEVGQCRILCYGEQASTSVWSAQPFAEGFTKETIAHAGYVKRRAQTEIKSKFDSERFWSAWHPLTSTGLLEAVPFIVDAPADAGGEPIHPLGFRGRDSDRLEDKLAQAAHDAAVSLLGGHYAAEEGWLIPVPRHMAKATVETIFRPLYRPHTRQISKWFADQTSSAAEHLKNYTAISEARSNAVHRHMQHQL